MSPLKYSQRFCCGSKRHPPVCLLPGSRLTSSSRQFMAAEDSESVAAICERDMHSLHRNVPALRRTDVDTSAIRHHFYPDGGWGWANRFSQGESMDSEIFDG
ncbi:hypothetical protein FOCC_FOCC004699 [Frankliniella occidentalis]|nr:hypothetical protein FOCC_FOCC004699 [Frankliniella occidentalis]